MDDKSILQAAAAIQNYLVTRPEATDTLEGIHAWWIERPAGDEPSMEVTQAALEHLEVAGVMERTTVGRRAREVWRLRRNPSGPHGDE